MHASKPMVALSEQVNLLFGETQTMQYAHLQSHSTKLASKLIYSTADLTEYAWTRCLPILRELMYKVKAQGVDITRIFCGLNDVRNIIPSIQYAKSCRYDTSGHHVYHLIPKYIRPIITSTCRNNWLLPAPKNMSLKDMAGIGRPVMLGKKNCENNKNFAPRYYCTISRTFRTLGFPMASMPRSCQSRRWLSWRCKLEPFRGMVHRCYFGAGHAERCWIQSAWNQCRKPIWKPAGWHKALSTFPWLFYRRPQ